MARFSNGQWEGAPTPEQRYSHTQRGTCLQNLHHARACLWSPGMAGMGPGGLLSRGHQQGKDESGLGIQPFLSSGTGPHKAPSGHLLPGPEGRATLRE